MGGVVKVFNPIEHVKAATKVNDVIISHVPAPAPIKKAASTVNHVAAAQAESLIQHPVRVAENVVKAVKNPTWENLLAAVPSDSMGITSTPAQIVENVRQLLNSKNLSDLLEKTLQINTKEFMKASQTMQLVYTAVIYHLNTMKDQATAENKWRKLPQSFINDYRQHYSINLAEVRYAESINTKVENTAIAFPGEIFFPRSIDFVNDEEALHWMLHELTHLEQYNRLGGLKPYLDEYSSDIAVKVITRQTFEPHDLLQYEIEAEEKADRLCGSLLSNRISFS